MIFLTKKLLSSLKKNMNYILEHLSPFLLAVWYMDDGSKKMKKKIKRKDGSYIIFKNGYIDSFMIATNGFSFEECKDFCDYIKITFGISGHVQSDRGTPRISISDNASKIKFKEINEAYSVLSDTVFIKKGSFLLFSLFCSKFVHAVYFLIGFAGKHTPEKDFVESAQFIYQMWRCHIVFFHDT